MDILRGFLGLFILLGFVYLISNNRKGINWRLVTVGLLLQFVFAFGVLKVDYVRKGFEAVSSVFVKIISFSEKGAEFVIGPWPSGLVVLEAVEQVDTLYYTGDTVYKSGAVYTGDTLYESRGFALYKSDTLYPGDTLITGDTLNTGEELVHNPFIPGDDTFEGQNLRYYKIGYVFAFKVLPTIIFFSALSALLYYLGLLQRIVWGFAWVMSKTMRLSGAESLAAAGNIFLGQTEAPLLVKPYLEKMTKSEIMSLMTGGMATIAGGVFAAYIGMLGGDDPAAQLEFAKHLLSASIMSAPAAIVVAKVLYPEDQPDLINTNLMISKERIGDNVLDAVTRGTSDGVRLAVNVGAMLLAFMGLIFMFNYILSDWIGSWTGLNDIIAANTSYSGLSLEFLLGMLFAPVAWILGVASNEITEVGQVLGMKTVFTEFIAYVELGMIKDGLSNKSVIIATYALCGFANFASIGIQIGGIGALAPGQRKNLSKLGFKALIGGTVAAFMTAAIAGMLV